MNHLVLVFQSLFFFCLENKKRKKNDLLLGRTLPLLELNRLVSVVKVDCIHNRISSMEEFQTVNHENKITQHLLTSLDAEIKKQTKKIILNFKIKPGQSLLIINYY